MLIIEKELKRLITNKMYDKLDTYFSDKKRKQILQVNYYYDTENKDLLIKGETLRVRQIEESLVLQHKYEKTRDGALTISKEVSSVVDTLPHEILLSGVSTKNIGCLITNRTEIKCDGFTVCLDKNYYLGKFDCELEIEIESGTRLPDEMLNLIKGEPTLGKYTRFARHFDLIHGSKISIGLANM